MKRHGAVPAPRDFAAEIHPAFVEVGDRPQWAGALLVEDVARSIEPRRRFGIETAKNLQARQREPRILHRIPKVCSHNFIPEVILDDVDIGGSGQRGEQRLHLLESQARESQALEVLQAPEHSERCRERAFVVHFRAPIGSHQQHRLPRGSARDVAQ